MKDLEIGKELLSCSWKSKCANIGAESITFSEQSLPIPY